MRLISLLLLFLSGYVQAQSVLKVETKNIPANTIAAGQICKSIGERMLVGKGPYGFGAFDSFHCEKAEQGAKVTHNLLIEFKEKEIQIRLTDNSPDLLNREEFSKLNLPLGPKWTEAFSEDTFFDLIALNLLRNIPNHFKVESKLINRTTSTIRAPRMVKSSKMILTLPPNLLVFEKPLSGGADTDKLEAVTIRFLGFETSPEDNIDYPTWRVEGAEDFKANEPIEGWFNAPAEVDPTANKLESLLTEAYTNLTGLSKGDKGTSLFDVVKGLVGRLPSFAVISYGVSTVSDPELLSNTRFFSIASSVAITDNHVANIYYEEIPRVKDDRGQELFFRRLSMGYAFNFSAKELTKGQLNFIDVVPRLSLWKTDAKLSLGGDEAAPILEEFKLDNTFSIGIEGGASKFISDMVLRGFIGFGVSNVQNSNVNTLVKNYNAGASYLIPGHNFGPLSLTYMITYRYENLDFQNDAENAIKDINIANHFLGAGLGVTW